MIHCTLDAAMIDSLIACAPEHARRVRPVSPLRSDYRHHEDSRDQPKCSEMCMAYLLTRNSRIEKDLLDQLFNSSEKRLAAFAASVGEFRQGGQPPTNRFKY